MLGVGQQIAAKRAEAKAAGELPIRLPIVEKVEVTATADPLWKSPAFWVVVAVGLMVLMGVPGDRD